MKNFTIVKDMPNKEKIIINYSKDNGFIFKPQNKVKYKGVKVNTLVIMKPDFIEKLLKKKIKRKLDYYLLSIISLMDDDEGTTDGVRSALTELDRYKTIVEFKYKKYLNEQYLNLLYKKIAVLERELKMKLLLMQEEIYDMEELKGKSR